MLVAIVRMRLHNLTHEDELDLRELNTYLEEFLAYCRLCTFQRIEPLPYGQWKETYQPDQTPQ